MIKHKGYFRGNRYGGYRQSNYYNNNDRRDRFIKRNDWQVRKRIEENMFTDNIEAIKEEQYVAKNRFADFKLLPEILNNLTFRKYLSPTAIQDQAIPAILAGRDVIGLANTGTGKTAAFLIPLIQKVYQDKTQKVLIITPTRELAMQIYQEFYSFSANLGLKAVNCIGGMPMSKQRQALNIPTNFVIGTPGRLKDLARRHLLNLGSFNNVVLDEADRMIDIGFIGEIRYFIQELSPNRQSLFFSATISSKEQELLQAFVHNPVRVSVKQADNRRNIHQELIKIISKEKKIDQLHDLLIKKNFERVLIFAQTKHLINDLTRELVSRGFKADAIHGNKSQTQRIRVLDKFKENKIQILLATDVASRGLDINNISHVINYDLPNTYEDYIHRIGRTGRANKQGMALTFVEG